MTRSLDAGSYNINSTFVTASSSLTLWSSYLNDTESNQSNTYIFININVTRLAKMVLYTQLQFRNTILKYSIQYISRMKLAACFSPQIYALLGFLCMKIFEICMKR